MTAPDYAARAAAGAAYLDQHRPGWAGQIDLGLLDLADECDCVLGQLSAGGYSGMRRELGLDLDGGVIALGFSLGIGPWEDWAVLGGAWAAEITRRRDPAQLCRARPDDCPDGPEPHTCHPPEIEGLPCCVQPGEES